MNSEFIGWSAALIGLLLIISIFVSKFEDWLGSQGILRILNKHKEGMTVSELLAWREANWKENVDLYPNIPNDVEGCTRLLDKLCAQEAVISVTEGGVQRYLINTNHAS